MGLDQKGSAVFRVKQGKTGKWNVMEAGVEKPLASFDTQNDASEYAFDLASTKAGSKVEIFNEHGAQIAEYIANDQVITVRAGIGMAIDQGDEQNYTHLIKQADVTMRLAEMHGNSVSFQQFTRH
jgi:GGDEF domain-containing protein